MDSSMSPLLAIIFMDNLECKILNSTQSKDIIFWCRYANAILACFTGTGRELKPILEFCKQRSRS